MILRTRDNDNGITYKEIKEIYYHDNDEEDEVIYWDCENIRYKLHKCNYQLIELLPFIFNCHWIQIYNDYKGNKKLEDPYSQEYPF